MTIAQNKRAARHASRSRQGFTLVELMLVMFILSVLVALVVGVSSIVMEQTRKTETLDKQQRLMTIVEKYRKVTNHLPYISSPGDIDYDPYSNDSYQIEPEKHMERLYKVLRGQYPSDNQVKAAIEDLLDDSSISMTTDAYGKIMVFFSDKGAGGSPVIVSAGPDGVFGYERDIPEQQRSQYKEDNIRSDTTN